MPRIFGTFSDFVAAGRFHKGTKLKARSGTNVPRERTTAHASVFFTGTTLPKRTKSSIFVVLAQKKCMENRPKNMLTGKYRASAGGPTPTYLPNRFPVWYQGVLKKS